MRNKFNARKCEYKGMNFDSKKELARYMILEDMYRRGAIKHLRRQVEFELISGNDKFKPVKYVADFMYRIGDNDYVEDVKGYKKGAAYQVFRIKQKLMYDKHGINVFEI